MSLESIKKEVEEWLNIAKKAPTVTSGTATFVFSHNIFVEDDGDDVSFAAEDDPAFATQAAAAYDQIRNQGRIFVLLSRNMLAVDGRKYRAFRKTWAEYLAAFPDLRGGDRQFPLGATVAEARQILENARVRLIERLPASASTDSDGFPWGWLAALGLLGGYLASRKERKKRRKKRR